MKKLSLLGVLVLLLATASLSMAQAAKSTNLTFKASNNSGVTGTGTATEAGAGVKFSLSFKGFPPNSEHAGHVHQGTCEKQGAVVYPLTPAKADAQGNATVEGEADAPFSQLTNGNYYVNYHVALTPPGDGVSCANIVLAQGGGTGVPSAGQGGTVGSTDSLNLWLLGGLALVLFGSTTTYMTIRRRGAK